MGSVFLSKIKPSGVEVHEESKQQQTSSSLNVCNHNLFTTFCPICHLLIRIIVSIIQLALTLLSNTALLAA